jgi:hypothetical protein
MENEQRESKIDQLAKKLNRVGEAPYEPTRHRLSKIDSGLQKDWLHEEKRAGNNFMVQEEEKMAFSKKILIASVAFFVVTAGIGSFFFFGQKNIFSPENINISISGPVSAEGGKEIGLQIVVTNENSVALDAAELVIDYPEGTKDADNLTKDLSHSREYVGVVTSGGVVNKTARSVLFGEEGSQKEIKVSIEYRAPNSNAIFVKAKSYTLAISSSPISVTVDTPSETNTGQEMVVKLKISSNSSTDIKNMLVDVVYPPGFQYKSSNVFPASKNNVWKIENLGPGKNFAIEITGILEGQNDETKTFRVSTGLESEKNPGKIATVYNSALQKILISKPFVGVALFLNGSQSAEYVVDGSKQIRGDIEWTNNTSDTINSGELSLKFIGQALDKISVSADEGGFYQSTNNTISWNKSGVSQFASIEPGASGRFSFSFSSLSLFSEGQPKLRNPAIDLEATFVGSRTMPGRTKEQVQTKVTRRVKIATSPQIAARSLYSTGPFVNSGPIPPKAENQTTYTVVWSVSNSSSDMSDTTVEATLPPYVKWLNVYAPQSEKMTYDPDGGKVIWNVGVLRAGTGITSSAREVSFQVAMLPSVAQINSAPSLTSDAVLQGSDDFTGIIVKSVRRAVTTILSGDPSFRDRDGIVIQ